ncbi:tRNA (5-methylaminomethyl-2-thiouridylate)-methyltransferase [Kwoniella dejecticola CBS 10117]|uniref:tRNA-5-taurinomethyluridine 2-sulfurtransferase n=1 Tax=Kwoniella dejecticola CBS 10117 TaxID=1296121 RepID=A0A1A5ZV29_9TREE|nr:tRNA (5-methylaminomethyl-2-thiouridylate)-methyltransferase [Kwoniella dejecticola CBS 10117]OBR81660.1 tRNA (5-methylaminomethyl-2-thiouridylate)-methyltransferase [Kwoniella dejecticola CBS 10117]
MLKLPTPSVFSAGLTGAAHPNPTAGPSRIAAPHIPRKRLRLDSRKYLSTSEVKGLLPSLDQLGLQSGDNVTVAVSGGVDSATTLRILCELPVNLDVIFMRNWDPLLSETNPSSTANKQSQSFSLAYNGSKSSGSGTASTCQWEKDWNDVQAITNTIGIPRDKVRLVDLSKEYWSRVFEPSINVWENGGTPNPDVDCNREIKFGALMEHLPRSPRHFLATGHYGRVDHTPFGSIQARLTRAKDQSKDQTYYLSQMNEHQLSRTILPLGGLTKSTVRQLATHWNLPNANKEESMGVCFIGERGKFGDFISQYTSPPSAQGHLVSPSGDILGTHKGLWYYTIGQRAKIPNQLQPMFVARKGVGRGGQDILVVPGHDHPLLQCTGVITDKFHWIHGTYPSEILDQSDGRVKVQVRHRMRPISASVSTAEREGSISIEFDEPLSGVSPGQVAAIWYDDWCLGSGVICDTRCLGDFSE